MAGNNGYVDAKTVGKLENFSGAPEKWSEWSFKARACFGVLDVGQGAIDVKMDEAEKMMTEAVYSAAVIEDAQAANTVVSNVLAQVPGGNGLQCWRRLVREFEPDSGAR